MRVDKITVYLFFQISKYFILILFIFLSIAWLLQISRLFTVTNFLHIEVIDIILLSFYLVPNIITIIIPFILIFGLLLCFIKLNRDNELISILSFGFGLKPFKVTLIFFTLIVVIFFSILNFYLAPNIYGQYKDKEYNLRNTLNFNKISFSNFINLNQSTILDFNKNNNQYEDIFISFFDDKENIVYAKKGNITNKINGYNFQLSDGFKISIDKNKQIEKLEFKNYILKIDRKKVNNGEIIDKNTFTIFDDIRSKNYINISFKVLDIILILYVIYLFYTNNLVNIKFNTKNIIYFSISSMTILIINQILKNSEINFLNYIFIIISLICVSFLFTQIINRYE